MRLRVCLSGFDPQLPRCNPIPPTPPSPIPPLSLQYFASVISGLLAVAWIGQQVHNLFLTYLIGECISARRHTHSHTLTHAATLLFEHVFFLLTNDGRSSGIISTCDQSASHARRTAVGYLRNVRLTRCADWLRAWGGGAWHAEANSHESREPFTQKLYSHTQPFKRSLTPASSVILSSLMK